MQEPISSRGAIPFYYDKSEAEFQADPYERFDPMVVRQSALHLADAIWGHYPMQAVLDFGKPYISLASEAKVVELGCGVGRWIATLAQTWPHAQCWGLDYSYQMLRRAQEYWVDGATVHLDLRAKGFPERRSLVGRSLPNLSFGLAEASQLPFTDNSQDLVLSSFLLDRLSNPKRGLAEMSRVLKPGGRIILITPLNFSKAEHWEQFYPPVKIALLVPDLHLQILEWQEGIEIHEPLDAHGNGVHWKALGMILEKQ